MTEKLKNSPARLGTIPFLLIWSMFNVVGWVLMNWLWNKFQFAPNTVEDALLVTLVPGIIAAVVQTILMEYGLKKSAVRAWLPVTLAGQLVAALLFNRYMQNYLTSGTSLNLTMLILTIPVAVIQALWLHRRIRSAWLWIAGGVVTGLLLTIALQESGVNSYKAFGMAGLLQGIVGAAVMRHLWTQEREKDKHKIAAEALTEDDQDERIERLHDAAPVEHNDVESESLAGLLRS